MTEASLDRSLICTQSSGLPVLQADRRASMRYRTVYRVAPAYTACDSGLVRVRNISDGGMALDLVFPVRLGEEMVVALSDGIQLSGRVGWVAGLHCGLRFDQPIDSLQALRQSAEAIRGPAGRPPRLRVERAALASGVHGRRLTEVLDVSQRGMKLAHDGSFTPGLNVRIKLASGVERSGVVRWERDGIAGVMLKETFTPQELGSVRAL